MLIRSFIKVIILASFFSFIIPQQSSAMKISNVNTAILVTADSSGDSKLATEIITRVNEIQEMDKSNLSPTEKKALRKELKGLKDQAEGLNSKVYLSVGAIIIIILLLILILR